MGVPVRKRRGERTEFEANLSRALGRDATIIGREASGYRTSARVEVIRVLVDDEDAIELFAKPFGGSPNAHPDKQVPERERRVYEDLFADTPGLPVPRYFGTVDVPETGEKLLLLEQVGGYNLRYHDVDVWVIASRRLAQLHAHFTSAERLHRESGVLLRIDGAYIEGWTARAIDVLSARPQLIDALSPALARLPSAVELLGRTETLIHNDLSPKNLIADPLQPTRAWIVDWELAAIGCPLLDLVHFCYGLAPTDELQVRRAYLRELGGSGLLPSRRGDLARLFAAARLEKTLYRLARSSSWRVPETDVRCWIDEAVALGRIL